MYQALFQALYIVYLIELLQHPFEVASVIIPTLYSKESETQRSLPKVIQLGFKSQQTYCRACPFTAVLLIILEGGFEILRTIYFIKTAITIYCAFDREGPTAFTKVT